MWHVLLPVTDTECDCSYLVRKGNRDLRTEAIKHSRDVNSLGIFSSAPVISFLRPCIQYLVLTGWVFPCLTRGSSVVDSDSHSASSALANTKMSPLH